MTEEWPADGFERELASRDRVIVLYHATWCPFSRAILRDVEDAVAETSVPLALADVSHPQDPRWDDMRVAVVPTLAYYEHGEELERAEATRRRGLARDDMDAFLEAVEALQEQWRVIRGRLRPDRFG